MSYKKVLSTRYFQAFRNENLAHWFNQTHKLFQIIFTLINEKIMFNAMQMLLVYY